MYNRWITPLKLSLERIESKFDTLQHQLVVQAETSLTLSKPSLKHPGPQLESSPAVVNKPSLPVSPNLAQSQLQPETSTSAEESVESGKTITLMCVILITSKYFFFCLICTLLCNSTLSECSS